jgi:hypothetical protein
MALWKLQPLDPDDPGWEASSHRGLVIVRTPDEAAAPEEAQRTLGVKTRFPLGASVKAPPWLDSARVAAERIHDPRYDEAGPNEVLEPSFTFEIR